MSDDMKKIFIALIFMCEVGVLSVFATEKVKIGALYYDLNTAENTAEVISCGNGPTTINIPASIEYNSIIYRVTSIRNGAFLYCPNLITIIIPNSITHIEGSAFLGCDKLNTPVYNSHCFAYLPRSYKGAYTIPDGIQTIAKGAFQSCTKMTSILIPNSVTSIGENAFYNCKRLTSVTIPNNVTSIGMGAFKNCDGLLSVKITNSVKSIGRGAFKYCDKIDAPVYNSHCFAFLPKSHNGKFIIPDGIESITEGAFDNCKNLTSVEIPNSVKSIGHQAFIGCSKLNTPVYNSHCFAYLPRSYKGAYTIPDGIQTIEPGAFLWCKNLTSVTIPSSVTFIGADAFGYCQCLTSIIIPNNVISIGKSAFRGCCKLNTPVYNSHCFAYMPESDSGAYIIPNGIESITEGAFYNCNITSVTIPNSVRSIGNEAFLNCLSLTTVILGDGISVLKQEEIFKSCNNLKELRYPKGTKITVEHSPSTKLIAYTPSNSYTNSSTNTTESSSDRSTSHINASATASQATTIQSAATSQSTYTKPITIVGKPICRILSPESGYYSTSTIILHYIVENISEGQAIEYYVDDPKKSVQIQGTKGIHIEKGTELKIEMPQYGKHVVGIRIVDAYGMRSEDTRIFEYRSEHKPTLHVFAVGVNKYKAEGFTKLDYAEQDAIDFANVVMDMADKNTYKKVDTTLILGSAATTFNLQEQLTQLTNQVESNDVVMIFFSGHGLKENKKSYFISSDAVRPYHGLDMEFIRNRADEMDCPVFVFMDACHSGPKTKGTIEPITVAESGVVGFYSCKAGQQSVELSTLRNGVFTNVLVNGLRGEAANKGEGYITIFGLENYIKEQVPPKSGWRQTPVVINSEIGDAILFYLQR